MEFDLNSPDSASTHYREESTNDPIQLSKSLCNDQLFEEALGALAEALEATQAGDFAQLPLLLEKANVLCECGSWTEAHDLYTLLQSTYNNNCHAYRAQSELFVKEKRYEEALEVLIRCPLRDTNTAVNIDTIYRLAKLRIYLACRGSQAGFAVPEEAPALSDVAIVMMVRNEGDIIRQSLEHHHRLGFRKFVIILNLSTDDTDTEIASFKKAHDNSIVVTIRDSVEGFYQSGKTQAAIYFTEKYFSSICMPVKWCFVLDADEFLNFTNKSSVLGLLNTADNSHHNVIVFHLCNATNRDGTEYQASRNIYEHFDVVVNCSVPIVTKNAFALRIDAQIAEGNHSVWYNGLNISNILIAAEHNARIVHLPVRSSFQLKSKIVNGASGLKATTLSNNIGEHWRAQYKDYSERGDVVFDENFTRYWTRTKNEENFVGNFYFR
jgi:glycosyltransferase involved in cell wall biosynthesis